ncbi:MAG TPA: universal stress protein [Puia sp.]|uniref:universal stress protein n=1 Tax=Puia sp. TaxID=2045100 RepID=UPI002C664155|nr:universal stress protein [Puia sp.]HVU93995.1 universal stress protein [Puia sp.]
MKKLLVLVDFSAPSVNAVAYAAGLAQDKGFAEIVLMSNCFVPLFEQIVPNHDLLQMGEEEIDRRMESLMKQLLELKSEIGKQLPHGISVRIAIGTKPLLRSVVEEVTAESPSLAIIGTSRRAPGDDCSIGRQIIPLARVIPVPVLVIPPEARYQPIRSVLVAGTTEASTTLLPLLSDLEVIQYDPPQKEVIKGVLKAAADQQVQLIVALPRKHSFFYNLTHQNIMQGVVLNAAEPVLILK